ncbi:sporulation protein [Caldibacillus lycopersici]|uniref:Sporulation protein n=1 Tax=Perspicuibacillus lycopersici TaxID=1325689 RepID=A0AAE3LN61_9BACI|nr:sporulation protein [Perspicuibacillus lycopersici]MCU9613616.1 sporulation protein [Perspicuibacillus lycopersici]
MSFINKVFASVGIGGAEIDVILDNNIFTVGEEINGRIEVKGGSIEQKIESLYLTLKTNFLRKIDEKMVKDIATIGRFQLSECFTIKPNEKIERPFSFTLSVDTPLTYGKTKIWIESGADIKNAIDPTDKDYIKVVPNELMAAVINSVANLGFSLRNADCELVPNAIRNRLPIIQEFEFVPYEGIFRGRLEELEIVFVNQSNHRLNLFMEMDRKERGLVGFFSEAFEMDEKKIQLSLTNADIPYMEEKIIGAIKAYI